MSSEFSRSDVAEERCCLTQIALRGDHASNNASVNAPAGRTAHGGAVMMLMLISELVAEGRYVLFL